MMVFVVVFSSCVLRSARFFVDASAAREPASQESIEKFFEAFDEGDDGDGGDGDDDDEGSPSSSSSSSSSFQSLENLVKLAQKVADESEYAREGTSRASDGMPGRAMDASDDDWDEIDFSDDFESEEEENTMWESISQSGAITNECGHGESKEYSLCFKIDEESKSESVSRQATTVPVNVIGGALIRFEIAVDALSDGDGDGSNRESG